MTDPVTITIITTTHVTRTDAERWARDDSGDVHFYRDDSDQPIATVEAEQFVAAVRGTPTVWQPAPTPED